MAKGFSKPSKETSYPHPIINVIHVGRIKPGSSDIFWVVAYEGIDELNPGIKNIVAKNKKQAIQEFLKVYRQPTLDGGES